MVEGVPISKNQPRGIWVYHHAADCDKVNDPEFGPLAYPVPDRPCTCGTRGVKPESTMSRRHTLKSWPEHFEPMLQGIKTLEIRRDDRGFQVGDVIELREWSPVLHPDTGHPRGYTGRKCTRLVTHILRTTDLGGIGGLWDGYVLLSLWRITVDGQEVS